MYIRKRMSLRMKHEDRNIPRFNGNCMRVAFTSAAISIVQDSWNNICLLPLLNSTSGSTISSISTIDAMTPRDPFTWKRKNTKVNMWEVQALGGRGRCTSSREVSRFFNSMTCAPTFNSKTALAAQFFCSCGR